MDPSSGPGDVRPRQLERPPGDRYRQAPVVVRERPDLGRAMLLGVSAAIVVALAAALLRSALDVTVGLLAVAAVGGWFVGAAVRRGAWAGMAHRDASGPELLGLCLGALTWILALVLAWVIAMVILPGSERSLNERLTATPFLDWLAPQLAVADLLCLALAALLGWLGARSAATAPAS